MKDFTLRFIQIAWVIETVILIFLSPILIICLPVEKVNFWLDIFPKITALIIAQGTAAGLGPLASETIKVIGEKNDHSK